MYKYFYTQHPSVAENKRFNTPRGLPRHLMSEANSNGVSACSEVNTFYFLFVLNVDESEETDPSLFFATIRK